MKKLKYLPLIFLLLSSMSLKNNTGELIVYIGSHQSGEGIGISKATFDTKTGRLTPPVIAAESEAPSYLVIHPNKKFLYTTNSINNFQGKPEGAISAFKINRKDGSLTPINQQASSGVNPCHISLDKTGQFVMTANYNSGSIAIYKITEDGGIGQRTGFAQLSGSSVNQKRQEGPHAHCIQTDPSNKFVLTADLGSDKICIFRFNSENGGIEPNNPAFTKTHPGSGPRHFTFHPNGKYCFVVNELSNTIIVYSWNINDGILTEIQTISTLPDNYKENSSSAEIRIHPNGKFLYSTNRGHNSIAIFEIDMSTGKLRQIGYTPTQGEMPRNFEFSPDGQWMIVTNHNSDNAVIFKIETKTRRLEQMNEILKIQNPYGIRFYELD